MQATLKRTETVRTKPPNPPTQTSHLQRRDSTYAIGELTSLLAAAQHDKQIITKVQLFTLKPYTSQQFSNWKTRYTTVQRVHELSKKIEEVLESNLIYQGLNKNPAFPIFILKNNHGYSDKKEIDTNHNFVFNVTRGLPTPHQQRKLVKATQHTK